MYMCLNAAWLSRLVYQADVYKATDRMFYHLSPTTRGASNKLHKANTMYVATRVNYTLHFGYWTVWEPNIFEIYRITDVSLAHTFIFRTSNIVCKHKLTVSKLLMTEAWNFVPIMKNNCLWWNGKHRYSFTLTDLRPFKSSTKGVY